MVSSRVTHFRMTVVCSTYFILKTYYGLLARLPQMLSYYRNSPHFKELESSPLKYSYILALYPPSTPRSSKWSTSLFFLPNFCTHFSYLWRGPRAPSLSPPLFSYS